VSWDPVWETVFRSRAWGRYPPEELIRFVASRFGEAPDRRAVRILEVGCGTGANLWYLAREGFSVVGIDGSAAALGLARERLAAEGLEAELALGDFAELREHFEPGSFDAIVDVSSLQHNRIDAVTAAVRQIRETLKPGGSVFAMLVAVGSWGDSFGVEIEPRTRTDIAAGPLAGAGVCHFFSLEEVGRLFAEFADVIIEYSERSLDERREVYRHWVLTASRPG
jgi:SAM-dependent methyltransferase